VHHHPDADREHRQPDDVAAAECGFHPAAAESCGHQPERRADHSAACREAAPVYPAQYHWGVLPADET